MTYQRTLAVVGSIGVVHVAARRGDERTEPLVASLTARRLDDAELGVGTANRQLVELVDRQASAGANAREANVSKRSEVS